MDNLVKMLNNLSIKVDSLEIDLLCNKINSIKIIEEREEVKEELIKKELCSFFEILTRKGRCLSIQNKINIKWIF